MKALLRHQGRRRKAQLTGVRVHEDGFHAQCVGSEAGVLPPGPSEGAEGVIGHIDAAAGGDFLDGNRHVVNGDGQEARRDFVSGPGGRRK